MKMLVVSRRMFKYISLFSLFVKIKPSFSFILLPSVSSLNFAWNMFWFYKHWIILYFILINCHELVWKVLHETELKKYEWTTSFYLILVRRFYQTYKIGHTSTLTFIHELRVWIGSPFSSTQNFYQAHQLLSILIFYRFPLVWNDLFILLILIFHRICSFPKISFTFYTNVFKTLIRVRFKYCQSNISI